MSCLMSMDEFVTCCAGGREQDYFHEKRNTAKMICRRPYKYLWEEEGKKARKKRKFKHLNTISSRGDEGCYGDRERNGRQWNERWRSCAKKIGRYKEDFIMKRWAMKRTGGMDLTEARRILRTGSKMRKSDAKFSVNNRWVAITPLSQTSECEVK